jgi:hypothetical protein
MLDKESEGNWKTVIMSKKMRKLQDENEELADEISKIILDKSEQNSWYR